MSERLISTTSENDKASQLYQRHAELASLRDPYAGHLDSLADAQTRLDEIKEGGLRSKVAHHQEARVLERKLFNTQAAVDSQEGDPHDYRDKMADRIQKSYDANIEEAKKDFAPDNQEVFYDDAAEMNAEFVKNEAVNALASKFHGQWRNDRLQEDGTFEPRERH